MDRRGYKYKSSIGTGGYGTVDLYTKNGKKYAVKKIKYTEESTLICEDYLTEINCYRRCDNPHIIKMVDTFKDRNTYIIILECGDGSIYDMPLPSFKTQAYQILLGLYHLHSNGILHCDIKHNNIITFRKENRVAFTDFGISKFNMFNSANYFSENLYAPTYRAPEIHLKLPITSKVDSWAYGILLYSMCYGGPPYIHTNQSVEDMLISIFKFFGSPTKFENSTNWNIAYEGHKADTDIDEISNPHLKDLIIGLLNTNPDDRYSIADALNHPYFSKLNKGEIVPNLSPKEILDKYDFEIKFSESFRYINEETGPLSLKDVKANFSSGIVILAIQIALRILEKIDYDEDIFIISFFLSIARYDQIPYCHNEFEDLPNYERLQDKIIVFLEHLDYKTVNTTPCDYILLYENIYSKSIIDDAQKIAINIYLTDAVNLMNNYEVAEYAMRKSCNEHYEIFDPIL